MSFLPIVWVYRNLRVPSKSVADAMQRLLVNTGILAIGLLAVCLLQLVSHWLFGKVTFLSSGL